MTHDPNGDELDLVYEDLRLAQAEIARLREIIDDRQSDVDIENIRLQAALGAIANIDPDDTGQRYVELARQALTPKD